MKMLAVIALTAAIASPAMAQAPQAREPFPPPAEIIGPPIVVEPPAGTVRPPAVVGPPADEAFARAAPRHSPNPAWDVYGNNGRYKGSDPDPLVRDQLQRERQSIGE